MNKLLKLYISENVDNSPVDFHVSLHYVPQYVLYGIVDVEAG
jgi:hypothetical protein